MGTLATNSPADLIADYLGSKDSGTGGQVFGGTTGWTLSVGDMPDSPDQVVALFDSSAPAGIPNLLLEWAGLQVIIRGAKSAGSYPSAYLKARQVRDYLLGMFNAPPEFAECTGCIERGTINPLGQDDSDRLSFSNNFQLRLEPLPNYITTNITQREPL